MNAQQMKAAVEAIEASIEYPAEPSRDFADVAKALATEINAATLSTAITGVDPRVLIATFFMAGVEARDMVDREWVDGLRREIDEQFREGGPGFPFEVVARRIVSGAKAMSKALKAVDADRIMLGGSLPAGVH